MKRVLAFHISSTLGPELLHGLTQLDYLAEFRTPTFVLTSSTTVDNLESVTDMMTRVRSINTYVASQLAKMAPRFLQGLCSQKRHRTHRYPQRSGPSCHILAEKTLITSFIFLPKHFHQQHPQHFAVCCDYFVKRLHRKLRKRQKTRKVLPITVSTARKAS